MPLAVLAYFFGVVLKYPLNDSDLWWHLKTGELIVEQKGLPEANLFSYTTPEPLNENQKEGLRAHWLGQVFAYLAERAGGLAGVALLRNVLVLLPGFLLYLWLVRRRAGLLATLAVILYPTVVFSVKLFYTFERPQGFSFSLALVAVMVLERLKTRREFDVSWILLPVLMALWANIHAGFIIGNIIIIIYLCAESFLLGLRKFRRVSSDSPGGAFWIVAAASIALSFANPNTYTLFWKYVASLFGIVATDLQNAAGSTAGAGADWVRINLLEYRPLSFFFRQPGFGWLLTYWAFTGVIIVLLSVKYWHMRRIDVAELLTVVFLIFFAQMYARGQLFSLAVLPFYLGKSVIELRRLKASARAVSRAGVAAALVLSVVFCGYIYSYYRSAFPLTPGVAATWISSWYPKRAAAFLRQVPVGPPMYNSYNWGGFLIWSLYPRYQVFVDGRAIDNRVNAEADGILNARPGWRESLDAWKVNFALFPVVFRDTALHVPLAMELARDDGWQLIFVGENAAIFVRSGERNMPVIRRYALNKKYVCAEIVRMVDVFLSTAPSHPDYNLEKANALFCLGEYARAKAIYQRFPSLSRAQLKKLLDMGY